MRVWADDVALGVAAADADSLIAQRQDRLDGGGVVPLRERDRAVDQPSADRDRDLPLSPTPKRS